MVAGKVVNLGVLFDNYNSNLADLVQIYFHRNMDDVNGLVERNVTDGVVDEKQIMIFTGKPAEDPMIQQLVQYRHHQYRVSHPESDTELENYLTISSQEQGAIDDFLQRFKEDVLSYIR